MDKMRAEMEQEKALNAKILRESKAKDLLTAKGLKTELLPYINLGEDDEAMTNTINNLSVFFIFQLSFLHYKYIIFRFI